MGRPDLFTGGGGGVFAGSPFWALEVHKIENFFDSDFGI
jgi:hypothetical protein